MNRTTRKQVEAAFDRFLAELGGRRATSYGDVGGYRLDYVGMYGGYNIEQVRNEGGGVNHPFGPLRRKASEMYDTLNFAEYALRLARVSDLRASAQGVIEWAKEPGDHGGNPYCKPFIRAAMRGLGEEL